MSEASTLVAYLPVLRTRRLLDDVAAGSFAALEDIGAHADNRYDRVGADRFLAVLADMHACGFHPPRSLLDVGCNVGTIAAMFAAAGYQVCGIDNDLAPAIVDGTYADLAAARTRYAGWAPPGRLQFEHASIFDWMRDNGGKRFDVVLLLSVVHQWWDGYGGSGLDRRDEPAIRAALTDLFVRANDAVYLEHVEEQGSGSAEALAWVSGIADPTHGFALVAVGQSVDADGRFRTLYRWSRRGGGL